MSETQLSENKSVVKPTEEPVDNKTVVPPAEPPVEQNQSDEDKKKKCAELDPNSDEFKTNGCEVKSGMLGGKSRRRGRKQRGGKSRRGGTAWTDLVKRVFNQNKHKSGYKFKHAFQAVQKAFKEFSQRAPASLD